MNDSTGSRTFTRDPFGREFSETLPDGWRIEREYDLIGRPSIVRLKDPTGKAVHLINYSWNPTGSLASARSSAGEFSYTYHPKSPALVTELLGPAVTTEYSYEPQRNLLIDITHTLGNSSASALNYRNDKLGRRVEIAFAGDAFQNGGWVWSYNDQSEITDAKPQEPNLGTWSYRYDAIW